MSVKISGASMAGSVTAFALTPDGATAVYIADQETVGRFELYSTPVGGSSAAVKISEGLALGAGDEGVSAFQISPDGTQVVFVADPSGGGVDDIFSVPIDGSSAPVQLNSGSEAPVTGFGVTPDSSRAAFVGVAGSGAVELYSAAIGAAGSGVRITDVASGNASGNVVAAVFSPDSTTVVFAADPGSDDVFEWLSVSLAAGTPGTEVQLSDAMGFVSLGAISPDSSTVVYTADEDAPDVMDLFAVPIGGGSPIRLNPAHSGNGVSALAISSGGTRVAYLADQHTADVLEVYSALIDVAASGSRLNTALSGTQLVDTLTISPDGTTVLYEADENTPGTFDLLAVPIDGSASPSTLHGLVLPDNAGFFSGVGTPVIGRRAVYPVIGAEIDLFSVPFAGGEASTRLNDPMAAGEALFNAFLPSSALRLIAFGVGSMADGITTEIHSVAVRRDLAPEQVNVTAVSGALGVLTYGISSDENYAVYLQDEETLGTAELFSRELDSDADTVTNTMDNCPFVANSSQASVVLGQTVTAASKTSFAWDDPTEVRFVRGLLAMVGAYATDDSGTLFDATSHTDETIPASGAGLYYLFAPDCAGRSYQTAAGAEPDRDLAAFP